MLTTHQCQKPLPVGASGSYMLMAKLLVAFGAPDQASAGDTFGLVQPKRLAACSLAILPPGLMSVLVRVRALAAPAPPRPQATSPATKAKARIACLLPLTSRRPWA